MTDNVKYDPIAQAQNVEPPNRGYENRVEDGDPSAIYMTLMQIDETLINYITDVIAPSVEDNGRLIPVPIIYASPERWKSIRKDGFIRDAKNDKIQPPLVTIRRTNITRNRITNPSNKYLYITHQRRWNRRNAYDRFSVLNGIRPSEEFRNTIVPDYVDITYQIILWTPYQEQLNKIIEQFHVENEEYWGNRNNYKFRVKIESYSLDGDLPTDKERVIKSGFDMKVSAYLVPERMVKNFNLKTTDTKEFTAKKMVIIMEADNTGVLKPQDNIKSYYERMKAEKRG